MARRRIHPVNRAGRGSGVVLRQSLFLSPAPGINFLRQATHLNSGIRSLPPSMSPTNHSPFPPSHFVSAEPHYTFLPNYSMTISVALSRISETERKHGIRGKGRSFYFRCSVDLTMPHMCLLLSNYSARRPRKSGVEWKESGFSIGLKGRASSLSVGGKALEASRVG